MTPIKFKPAELQWKIKAKGDKDLISRLSKELNINEILTNLLVQRGITTFEEARLFFRPSLNNLHDPFQMKNMDKAIERLSKALQNNEKILFYGDYDVDGTTSVALCYLFFKKIYSNIGYYIPNRYDEGYGISTRGIEYASKNGYSLIVSLDCGIKANSKIALALEKGIDFIVCDHHQPGEYVPEAYAVLDPKQKDCKYPYKDLSGCGVGFKLLQGFSRVNNIPSSELEEYLDLVAVSIASDIVPLTGENRILAYFGLKKLNLNPLPGIKSVINIAGLSDKEIMIEDIVFKIGPRINAAGRMESGHKAVELLISENLEEAQNKSKEINIFNNSRKNIDRKITIEALEIIASDPMMLNRRSTVLFNPKWHKGVVGIVASRLTDYYYRPTVVLTESNGFATGSARSIEGFDLYNAVDACSDLLENFGGHTYAAGLTLRLSRLNAFSERFEKVVANQLKPEQMIPFIEIDAEIELENITAKFYDILKQFQPFGPENMAPVFVTHGVCDSGCGRIVGNSKEHLKLDIVHEKRPTHSYPAIAFQKADLYDDISKGQPFDICYSIEENCFMGKKTIQLHIKDIKANLSSAPIDGDQ